MGKISSKKEPEYIFKVVAVGAGGVGKTSLIRRFATDKFQESYLMTLGVDFTTKEVYVKERDTITKIIVVDTAGQEYYSRLRPTYYSGANGCIICFDVTDKASFDAIPEWLNEFRSHIDAVDNIAMTLVGNKTDLKNSRKITKEEAEAYSKTLGLKYHETSAKNGRNVDAVFTYLASEILRLQT
ncbi:MAG: Rab family GTPase [Candidatus Odinarchaeota archaeon]